MRKFILSAACIVASAFFAGCSKDSTIADETKNTDTLAQSEVMVVFSPDQLGDIGYSDLILEAIQEYNVKKEEYVASGKPRIDFKYISHNTDSATLADIKKWAASPYNSLNEKQQYSRRLLVLTMESQIDMLNGVKLSDNDEILLLDVNTNYADSLSASVADAKRVHVVNISVASAIKKYVGMIKMGGEYDAYKNGKPNMLYFLTLNNSYLNTDSIAESILPMLNDSLHFEMSYPDKGAVTSGTIPYAIKYGYMIAQKYYSDQYEKWNKYSIVSMRSASIGYLFYSIKSKVADYSMLFVDGTKDKTSLTTSYYVKRRFDNVLKEWIYEWVDNPLGNMPKTAWHGKWDGYCEDNLPE